LDLNQDKVMINIQRYGNTSAASVPIALHEALEEGRLQEGKYVVLVAFGAGLTWGANLLRW
jgi:3-oxoacyl-[acyl-carrier-protein] synthase-3